MSTSPESGSHELGLDLDLHFLPAWAQKPAENQYAKFEGGGEGFDRRRGDRRERRVDRPPRRDGGAPGGGSAAPGNRRPGGFDRSSGPGRGVDRGRRPERFEPLPPPIDVNVSFIPEEKGVESLARQIRLTGRAYPLFDIAFLILKKPERYNVRFNIIKKADGQVAQPLFVCALDDTLWLSEQEAVDYVLGKHFATFYQSERTPTEPPKGTYTFVAQCGMSGAVLGPPNYHDYQNKLRKLHTERFARMPFDAFKSRIRIVRDEAVVKKWLEDQSWKIEFVCLNVPESLKLPNREEVEKHFRQVHMANVIKSVEAHSLGGPAAQALPTPALQRLVRRAWDEQMRFPIRIVTVLSQQFAGHGLQFFKVNKSVTHVAVARPRYLDLVATPVSEGVGKIVDFIQAHPGCTRRKIVEALVQMPPPVAAPEPADPSAPAPEPAANPEMSIVISDLHWLIHQGHVIEFAKGNLELAKKPVVRPPRPAPTNETAPAASAPTPADAGSNSTDAAASAEVTPPTASAPSASENDTELGTVAGEEGESPAVHATEESGSSSSSSVEAEPEAPAAESAQAANANSGPAGA